MRMTSFSAGSASLTSRLARSAAASRAALAAFNCVRATREEDMDERTTCILSNNTPGLCVHPFTTLGFIVVLYRVEERHVHASVKSMTAPRADPIRDWSWAMVDVRVFLADADSSVIPLDLVQLVS